MKKEKAIKLLEDSIHEPANNTLSKNSMSTKTSKEKCKCVEFPNSNLYDVSNCELHNTFTKVKEAKQVGEKVAICLDCHTAYYEWLSESNQCPACEGRIAVYDCLKRVTHKVATSEKKHWHNCLKEECATSEKEWTCPCGKPAKEFSLCSKECEKKYANLPTPPESEDWEAEFDKQFCHSLSWDTEEYKGGELRLNGSMITEIAQRKGWSDITEENIANVKNIKDFIRKVYQRGREEGYVKGQDDAFRGKIQNWKTLEIHEAIKVPQALQDYFKAQVLSLAVQEIEKEKKEIGNENGYGIGYHAGSDKAIEIISGLIKK